MKTTHWILVAALCGGAGIRLPAQRLDTVSSRPTINPEAGAKQLMLVHGLFSSSDTWSALQRRFYEAGDARWRVLAPDLYPTTAFTTNDDSLVNFMNNIGLESDAVVLGHSMGGIIARLASRKHRIQGLVTIGTPHLGAPLAAAVTDDPWNSPLWRWDLLASYLSFEAISALPWSDDDWAGPFLSSLDIAAARSDATGTIFDLAGLSQFVWGDVVGLVPAVHDLAPDSPAIANLNSIAGLDSEQIGIRASILAGIGPDGYITGPFLLGFLGNRGAALAMGDYLQARGSATFVDGIRLWAGADWESDLNWQETSAGFSLMALGDLEMSYWLFWNLNVIGGMPNDGVVPEWSMIMPRSDEVFETGTAVLHTEETSVLAEFLRLILGTYFVH
jgi:pimeloyl-ACP methyl ester carboxylesterase